MDSNFGWNILVIQPAIPEWRLRIFFANFSFKFFCSMNAICMTSGICLTRASDLQSHCNSHCILVSARTCDQEFSLLNQSLPLLLSIHSHHVLSSSSGKQTNKTPTQRNSYCLGIKAIHHLFYFFPIWNKTTRYCLEDIHLWDAFVWKQPPFSTTLPLQNHTSVKFNMLQTALHLVNNPLKNLLRKQAARTQIGTSKN